MFMKLSEYLTNWLNFEVSPIYDGHHSQSAIANSKMTTNQSVLKDIEINLDVFVAESNARPSLY